MPTLEFNDDITSYDHYVKQSWILYVLIEIGAEIYT